MEHVSVHTSKWIIEKCFMGDLVAHRTILLVVGASLMNSLYMILILWKTHNVAMARPTARFIVSMGPDGSIASQRHVEATHLKDNIIIVDDKIMGSIDDENAASSNVDEGTKSDGKLIMAEEIEEGHVSWAACQSPLFLAFFSTNGG
jgi:hypothetical protein